MGTALFAWELGGGLGHVGPMKVLAEALDRFGHRVVFALKDPISARLVLGSQWPLLQAPAWSAPRRTGDGFGASSYADIMAIRGFANADELERAVRAWIDLINLVRPDLLIADHSPTALLAAFGVIPAVTVGYGFYLPPAHLPVFPAFREGRPPVVAERVLLDAIRTVQARLSRPAPERLPQLFATHYTHVYSVPELDPYAVLRRTPALGPIEDMPECCPPPSESSLFAYLAADHPRIDDIALALGEIGMPVQVYIREAPVSLMRFLGRRGVHVHERAPSLSEVLPRVTAVLSHGSGGTTHAALFAGRPQLLIPRHMEGAIAASMLNRLGVGVTIDVGGDSSAIARQIRECLRRKELIEASAKAAERIAARFSTTSSVNLIDVCNQVLSWSGPASAQPSNPQRLTSIP